MPERLVALQAAVARVRQVCGPRLRLFVGGQVMDWAPEPVRALEVDLAAGESLETMAGASRLLTAGSRGTTVGYRVD